MEGFPRDIQNLIFSQLCRDAGGSTLALVPLLKTNRTFHTWTVRYVIDNFDEKHLTWYIRRMLPNLPESETEQWNVCDAFRVHWENRPSLLASFFIFLQEERMRLRNTFIHYGVVTRLFWGNNPIFRDLMETNVIIGSLQEKKKNLNDKKSRVRERERELRDLVLERNQLEVEVSLMEEKLEKKKIKI